MSCNYLYIYSSPEEVRKRLEAQNKYDANEIKKRVESGADEKAVAIESGLFSIIIENKD